MTPIYHITHIDNLAGIVQHGGLWCDSEMVARGRSPVGIAYSEIKARRARTIVPVEPGGVLADYVPFYFCNRSPMLYAIKSGAVQNYNGGQKEIVYLVSSVERVQDAGPGWCFTDGHAVEAVTGFYAALRDLDNVDWDVIESWSWGNREDDNDRKRRKQAEFLVRRFFPWELIDTIAVIGASMCDRVKSVIATAAYHPLVKVEEKWYY